MLTPEEKEKLRKHHLESAVHHNVMGNTKKSIQHTTLSLHAIQNDENSYLALAKNFKIDAPVWLFKKQHKHAY
jgi:hypothetical protein